ncbi:SDR family NAD(P)-dependent oxidoreductase [Pontibacter vulgaris]|uniref:SDR family NAD(P)-dependent oxidoreductase n=1 Tax=Pontibacter vulgaris TaxID=2905679 RepID=UPI001FA6BC0F|nr:SDR family NAD(P)-dependent oxidoreductase [Pontibacter vulgaris]
MTKIANSTVLITGGASGIGKLTAQRCLQLGATRVILWDINQGNLDHFTKELRAQGYKVSGYVVDVADAADVQQAAEQVLQETGPPDILVNNAGIVVGKLFAEHSFYEIERTLNINVSGVMMVTRAFLPAILTRGSGHIVNIASAAGLIPNPRMSVYAASKWAVLGWSESLRLELEQTGKNMHVTTITPSYIDTGMFAGVKAPVLTPIMQPEHFVEAMLDAIGKNKIILRKPTIVHLLPLFRGLLPARVFDFIVGRGFKVYTSMQNFTGRAPAEAVPEKRHH